jgi:D-serine deaminase-like pyridoxal phosphate-dependent protein
MSSDLSTTLRTLETPCLVLERGRLERNLARMRAHLGRLGVALRPHVKTAKCHTITRLALEGQPGGITVSTLKEAEEALSQGITDILYAVGITPNKLAHVAALRRAGADLTVLVDNAEAARALVERAPLLGAHFPALIEIDSDGRRAGVPSGSDELLALGQRLHAGPGTSLRGVMTHAGGSYACRSTDAIRAMAERERDAVLLAARRLREAGLPCPAVSVGSTPTATFSDDLRGVSEVRAGVYMFGDLVMAGLGVCALDDIAISVLTTVLGHQRDKGWIITDGGWTALSRDRGTADQPLDQGYGVVTDLAGDPIDDLIVLSTSQEHGILGHRRGGALDLERFPVGTALRILPNHACATAAQHDRYQVVDASERVEAVWPRFNGW